MEDRTGGVSELFSLKHLIQVNLMQSSVYPKCMLVLVYASGSWSSLTLTWQNKYSLITFPWGYALQELSSHSQPPREQ